MASCSDEGMGLPLLRSFVSALTRRLVRSDRRLGLHRVLLRQELRANRSLPRSSIFCELPRLSRIEQCPVATQIGGRRGWFVGSIRVDVCGRAALKLGHLARLRIERRPQALDFLAGRVDVRVLALGAAGYRGWVCDQRKLSEVRLVRMRCRFRRVPSGRVGIGFSSRPRAAGQQIMGVLEFSRHAEPLVLHHSLFRTSAKTEIS
jgi:hypothetical protein